jgi:hypothetical protein
MITWEHIRIEGGDTLFRFERVLMVHFAVVILTPSKSFLLWIWTVTSTRPDVKT